MGALLRRAITDGVTRAAGAWPLANATGPVAGLLDTWPDPAERGDRAARLCTVVGRGAIVLGSTLAASSVDAAAAAKAGLDVARRRAGGGAVLVEPGAQVWLDVWLPRRDPLWDDDVVRSSWWLGDVWCTALHGAGTGRCSVHRGPAVRRAWSDFVCFAGIGPGEVMFGSRKLVGLAQHRARAGARLQTMASLRWEPERLTSCLSGARDLGDGAGNEDAVALASVALGLLDVVAPDDDAPSATEGRAGARAALVVDLVEQALTAALT